MKRTLILLPFLATLLLFISPAHTTMVLPLGLNELASRADVVFKGTCTDKQKGSYTYSRTNEEIPVWIYTFRTEEVLKGDVPQTFELKQWAVSFTEGTRKAGYGPFAETTSFDVGKDYLLFLTAPSPFGFRSVIGSDQGKFNVFKNAQGKTMVVNPYSNQSLLKGVPQKSLSKSQKGLLQAPAGPISYDDLSSLVKGASE